MKQFLLLAVLVPAFSLNIYAQQPAGKPMPKAATVAPPVANFESAPNDPLGVRIYTLKNGMKLYLSVYKNAPRIQTYIAVRAGSKNDPSNATGLAHYLEHMLFKGTDVFGTKNFAKEKVEIEKIENLYEVYRSTIDESKRKTLYHQIDSISGVAAKYAIANEYDKMLAAIGADGTNAFTSFDETVYVNDIPSNQVSNWFKIEAERFRKPVLRLFHTELEAVYEEKNRGLDNDDNKVWEAAFEGLFKNHTYGTQTTIGTIEHLKNPSMKEINKYFYKHYVPNNMAIIMSGDFDPDKVYAEAEKYFGNWKAQPLETFTFQPESPINAKIVKEVFGPTPANVNLAFRTGADGTSDVDLGNLLNGILFNRTAGLLDLNLNQAQKVLNSSSYFYQLKDYGMFTFSGEPKEGQSLEEVERLLLSQIDLVKKGEFPDWLVEAVKTDMKLKRTKEYEQNGTRADAMLTAFVHGLPWQYQVNSMNRLNAITKADIMAYANRVFSNDNYVVVYKRIGEDKTVIKVEKPAITPVDVDRDNASPFVKSIENAVPAPIQPKFIDYATDVTKLTLKSGITVLYNKNTENNLFELYYKFDMGSNNSKLLPIAVKYIPYIAGDGKSAAEVQQEFYKLGCSFNVFSDQENTWVSISGLNDNYEYAVKVFEKLLKNPVVDGAVLSNLIGDIIKERNDNKLQKRVILRAMVSYARFGAQNPFTHVMSDAELKSITPQMISDFISSLTGYEHKVLYYGPRDAAAVKAHLDAYHMTPTQLKPVPQAVQFPELNLGKNVWVIDYDMKQAEILMLSNGEAYNPAQVPIVNLYNNYFGGGMSSVLFQDLRESKALAYSTYARYQEPNKRTKHYFNQAYIGSQADKLNEAMAGLSALLDNMPKADGTFKGAKEMIIQEIRTQRINRAEILFNYLQAEQLGNTVDIRKSIFENVSRYTYNDVVQFQNRVIKNKPRTIVVLGNKELLDQKVLEKYGSVKFLTLQDVFGY
jgi:predicted Zn-dependent peptidase